MFYFNGTATPEISTLSLHDALPISPLLGRQRHSGSVQQLGGDRATTRHDVQPPAAEMPGHLPAAAVGILAAGEEREHLISGRHAEPEDDARVAVVGRDPVGAGPQGGGNP